MILEGFPTDVDAHNRLGRAFMEMGNHAEARRAYSRALELDSSNTIARKNLSRLSVVEEGLPRSGRKSLSPALFVGEMGKVGVVYLDNLAPQKVLAKMVTGDEVVLKEKGRTVIVESPEGEFLGEVETTYGPKLAKMMQGGNRYIAAVVCLSEGVMKVIIKETYQHPSQEGRMSFPVGSSEGVRAYVKEGLVRPDLIEEPDEVDYGNLEWDEDEEEESAEVLPQGFSFVSGTLTDEDEE